mmetsp:Transcript_7285/g.10872  ORF Transcript_7285/g.10872 Transcript_7285/m.10872 type:complete len:143 (-) Transcript_7285:22-450(-)
MSLREPRGRLLRWMLDIQEYDFQLEHRSGASPIIAAADALSRVHESVHNVNENVWDLPKADEPRQAQVKDFGDSEAFVTSEDDAGKFIINEEGLVFPVERNTSPVLGPQVCRGQVLRHLHGAIQVGHAGVARTLGRLRRQFW